MGLIALGVTMVAFSIFLISHFYMEDRKWSEGFSCGLGMAMLIFGGAVLCCVGLIMMEKPKPHAIDVYRGNTTLEITYRDSIPVDTTVVWKVK